MVRVKGKSVTKTIKVIEHFAKNSKNVSVMELVRKLEIPQSTMSETLNALVDIGILARDTSSRTYSATPRLAALGLASQPKFIANGSLFKVMEECAAELGTAIGLFGICNLSAQLYQIVYSSQRSNDESEEFPATLGAQMPLHSSSIGHVLLAALGAERYEKLLWRMKAEARQSEPFMYSALCVEVKKAESNGWAVGSAGIHRKWRAATIILPSFSGKHPLAIAAFHQTVSLPYEYSLVERLRSKINVIF